ncbi:hypothetical protein CDCA_CDCA17G4350 [Cyanidium caldarium]|uniref:Uncharacterized protein n=1 Tax=Cyanidium caldarium TaxID=2771 RepID=A0AAV9J161_CYACA|nr:hypothetical protein CDCA_CDCA17G4350 [Cyanidium caldarium]
MTENGGERRLYDGMELTFLGTSSVMPTNTRNVPACALRIGGPAHRCESVIWLFDAGESTVHQLQKSHLRRGRVERIFITHLHGDHVFGLPSILCSLNASLPDSIAHLPRESRRSARTASHAAVQQAVHVYGPPGLRAFVRTALGVGRARTGVQLCLHEIFPPRREFLEQLQHANSDALLEPRHLHTLALDLNTKNNSLMTPQPLECELPGRDFRLGAQAPHAAADAITRQSPLVIKVAEDKFGTVYAAPIVHSVPTFGYVVVERPRPGKVRISHLKKCYGLRPGPFLRDIARGEPVEHPHRKGLMLDPAELMMPARPARKMVILGDTMDPSPLASAARNCQLLVHEATFGDEHAHRVELLRHSTARMAGMFARRIGVTGALFLTHFSGRYEDRGANGVEDLVRQAQDATAGCPFEVHAAEDLMSVNVPHPPGVATEKRTAEGTSAAQAIAA